jgi:hypothetical protein
MLSSNRTHIAIAVIALSATIIAGLAFADNALTSSVAEKSPNPLPPNIKRLMHHGQILSRPSKTAGGHRVGSCLRARPHPAARSRLLPGRRQHGRTRRRRPLCRKRRVHYSKAQGHLRRKKLSPSIALCGITSSHPELHRSFSPSIPPRHVHTAGREAGRRPASPSCRYPVYCSHAYQHFALTKQRKAISQCAW